MRYLSHKPFDKFANSSLRKTKLESTKTPQKNCFDGHKDICVSYNNVIANITNNQMKIMHIVILVQK